MGSAGRSTLCVICIIVGATHASPLPAQVPIDETLPCLRPVDGVTWMRWNDNRPTLDLWCQSVGRPVLVMQPASLKPGDITGMHILSWNVNVGAGRIEDLLPQLLKDASAAGMGLTVLVQEAFRAGDAVPETYPATLKAPKAIRPRRPTLDVSGIAERFGLSVAYVPSMRNGPATRLAEREDRGNAILSTEFLTDVRAIELPFGKQRRVAVSALIPARGGERAQAIRVVSTHFDTSIDRVTQSAALGERSTFLTDVPLYIGGDMNAKRGFHDGAVLALAGRIPLVSCGRGRTNRWPLRLDVIIPIGRLDFIFAVTQVMDVVRRCETLPHAYGSDHLPLLMTLRY